MKKNTNRGIWVIALLVAVIYPVLFPGPLGRGLFLKPVWNLDLARRSAVQGRPVSPETWFQAGDRFGYVSLDGRPGYLGRALWRVCLSDTGFINFGRISESVVFSDPAGQFVYGFQTAGYPLLDRTGKSLYVVSSDLSGIRRMDPGGETLWSRELAAPITTAAVGAEGVLLGLLDGRLLLADGQGRTDLELAPGVSRVSIVVGAALAPAGDRLAAISGLDPQRLSVLEKREGRWTPLWTRDIGTDLRREALLRFTEDGRFLLFEGEGSVGVLDLLQKRETRVPHAGRLVELTAGALPAAGGSAEASAEAGAEAHGTAALLARTPAAGGSGSGAELALVELPGRVLATERIGVPARSLRQIGGRLLLGLEGHLLRLDVQEE